MNKHFCHRISAGLLSLLLLLSLCVPAALAAEDDSVIHISTREDWRQLVKDCRLDSWSRDKVVFLDNDLDLSGEVSVPTFGGVFDGGGHTLSSFHITSEGDHLGLFRYIQEGGSVKNLTLKGNIVPSGTLDTVGGFSGVNSGVIENCIFEGFLSGGSGVGGFAGYNGATGQIIGCENRSGVVSGEHSTGGIVGVNYGSVTDCTNAAQINTQESTTAPQIEGVDWDKLNSTENMPACTDTGGIAGFSCGLLKDCSNSGAVGYPHTGYNVGGVAGRQSGYMTGCTNSGSIRGRKDVGGVVGQMEPYTLLRYQEDTLQQLGRELENLNSVMAGALNSTDSTRQQLSGHISALTGHANEAREQISGLLGELTEVGSGTVDTVNELARRIDRCMEQLVPVIHEMEQASGDLTAVLDQLEKAAGQAGQGGQALTDAVRHFRTAKAQMEEALRTLLTGVPTPLCSEDGPAATRLAELRRVIALLDSVAGSLPSSLDSLHDAYLELVAAADSLEGGGAPLKDCLDTLKNGLDSLSTGSAHITSALQELSRAFREQSDLPPLELPNLSPDFSEKENALSNTLGTLVEELEQMNQTANKGGAALADQLRKVNSQFSSITAVLTQGKQEPADDKIVDVSDENIASATQGKVTGCRSEGSVEGDVNVGGVAGSMAIEYDFDPEDDVTDQGSQSMNFQFLTRVILEDCVNSGAVESRKDCAGGAVGRMDLGVTVGCQNYAPVTSTDGEYAGGIAGSSRGVLRDCWSKCSLSGLRRIGGIAGFAVDVRDCRSLVWIREGASYLGAVIGDADRDCTLTGNTFVSEELGGVDGVSYDGKAAPLSHEDFMAQPGVPEAFSALTLTFTSGDQVISRLTVPYGGSVDAAQIPQVPHREGCHGSWSGLPIGPLYVDAQVEAVYDPLLTAIASSDNKVMAEGMFTPQAELTLSESTQEPPDGGLAPFVVDSSEPFTALRIALPPDCQRARLMRLDENRSWRPVETKQDGSFLLITLESDHAELCLIPGNHRMSTWAALAVIPGVILAALVVRKLGKKKGSSSETPEKKPNATV